MAVGLLDLPNELLGHICSYAMMYQHGLRNEANIPLRCLISDHLSNKLRILLRPMRSCRRLYTIARQQFLEVNVVALDLNNLRMSACRLEHQPTVGQILYTGNPDPLLARLVHVQVTIPLLDAPLQKTVAMEAANLMELVTLCRTLKSLHVILKVDSWRSQGTDEDRHGSSQRQVGHVDRRFKKHALAILGILRDLPVRIATVAFQEWIFDASVLDARYLEPESVVDVLFDPQPLYGGDTSCLRQTVRIATAPKLLDMPERRIKLSWGASDDVAKDFLAQRT
ncbi:uncharacterized protein PV09_07741 [Verruconis gallopava]|uniref:Uncharacterized protein n=1 Tax=Verruconis gallopava TaxID=253628 RepID=A0A0D2A2Z8_9PEZI|nr:uncharacterized protein PV09_07741 [Verruconis gallopava]KIW00760.1 hypothetical protein PV09_07741 [Verruconis gallopava]